MASSNVLQLASPDEAIARLDELEHRLRSMSAELANLHRLSVLGVLAAGIAHEINNLLTPVLSYAQLALARPDDQELRDKALERTCAGIESVSQIVHAILGMARGENDERIANLAESLDDAIRCMARNPEKDAVTVKTNFDDDTWVQINPVVLQQVLLNLVLNSIKAFAGRPGVIAISAEPTRDGKTRITVTDNGPGVPKDVLPTLFDSPTDAHPDQRKRRRTKAHTTHEESGSGLGLSVCRQLIESASGTISCISMPKDGATFTIVLPTAKVAARKAG